MPPTRRNPATLPAYNCFLQDDLPLARQPSLTCRQLFWRFRGFHDGAISFTLAPHVRAHRFGSVQDLRHRLQRPQERRPRDPPRRDLRPAGSERRRQDHADQHHLRHRQAVRRHDHRRRPRHRARLPRGARQDRPRAAGALHRHVRDGVEHHAVSAAALFGKPRDPARSSKTCCATCRCGTRRTRRS